VYDDYYSMVLRKIIKVASASAFVEDAYHSANSKMWLLKFDDKADEAHCAAALACGLFVSVELSESAGNSGAPEFVHYRAKFVGDTIRDCNASETFTRKVCDLVANAYTPASDTGDRQGLRNLVDARVVSFFDVVLPFYCERYAESVLTQWCATEYSRLSERGRQTVDGFYFPSLMANRVLKNMHSQHVPA
jgi:hypothetical protein